MGSVQILKEGNYIPFYDLTCDNNHEQIDVLLKLGERPPCPTCGSPTYTLWRATSNVIADDIPGGIEIKNCLCWPDGTPRRYYSKSEMAKEAKRRGYYQGTDVPYKPPTHKVYFT